MKTPRFPAACIAAASLAFAAPQLRADVVTDWNTVAGDFIVQEYVPVPEEMFPPSSSKAAARQPPSPPRWPRRTVPRW